MKAGVIGAGAAGLITSKILSSEGIEHDVFECNDEVGGTWIYKENFLDKYGHPVPSSMYKNLKTNLPKELMLFEGLDYDVQGISYLDAGVVLNYLKRFSKKFGLENNIKFEHSVVNISWTGSDWKLIAKDLRNCTEETYTYDAIFVCNGHYTEPLYPDIPGSGSFPGTAVHSHYYRVPEMFDDKTLLIIGYGPSGTDIALDVCPCAKMIYFSHHGPDALKDLIKDDKIMHKPDVKAIDGNRVYFMDETIAEVDAILYCTGYKYSFPFLDESCGIKVDDNYVYPLYKQLISIPHNSMFFIGIPFRTILFQLFELQAKCTVNILKGKAELPTKDEMETDTLKWEHMLVARGSIKRKYHLITEYIKEYFDELANLGNVTPCPDVLFKMFTACGECRKISLTKYRSSAFKVIDSNTFTYE